MNIVDEVKLNPNVMSINPVGSKVTCNPPPTGLASDEDWLIYVEPVKLIDFIADMEDLGFEQCGYYTRGEQCEFTSMKMDNTPDGNILNVRTVNLLISCSPKFVKRFMAATSVAKRLNLLKKDDRKALFQAVLYGNPCYDRDQESIDV